MMKYISHSQSTANTSALCTDHLSFYVHLVSLDFIKLLVTGNLILKP